MPVARLKWNDDYAPPDGWDYDTFRTFNDGRPPDVVFMAYDPDRVGGMYTRGGGGGEYVDDYDDGIARTQQYRPQ